jgi:peptidoglycan hydrolase-like protein with peptidoglycan-binding domain
MSSPSRKDRSSPEAHAPVATPASRDRPHLLTHLQRQVGNRAVANLLGQQTIQRLKQGDGPSHGVGVIQQQLNAVGASPRLAITGRFDSLTTDAAKAFQRQLIKEKIAGVVEDGVVDGETHKQLKARAPSVNISGVDTVVVGPGNTQVPLNPAAGMHVNVKAGDKGTAVKELQQRINNSPTMSSAARKARATDKKKLVVDGIFGPKTDSALKLFQTDAKVPSTGVADPGTWTKLMAAGAATQGHVEFDWREEVEGVRNVGLRANYDWRLSKTALTISVGINFIPKAKGLDSRINQWLAEIREIWSSFKAVNQTDPKKPSVRMDFEAKRGGTAANVNVFKGNTRSNASNWYAGDRRRGLASHEYGHLIGLADEYNRDEGQYLAVTGEEPPVGDTAGKAADAKTLASDIKAQMPLTDKPPTPWGTKLAAVVTGPLGRKQGGYSRLVRQEYEKTNGTGLPADIMAAFSAKGITGFDDNKSAAIRPFLYSNRSIMGNMQTAAPGGHEHPVEPRHVAPFVTVIAHEWTLQTGKADVWKPERR